MIDIYESDKIFFDYPLSIYGVLLFFLVVFIIFLFYLFINKKPKIKEEIIKLDKEKEIDYFLELEKLKKIESCHIFLQSFSSLFRTYLEDRKNYTNFSKMTLREILEKKDIEIEYKNFLEEIYFKQYKKEQINFEQKLKLIDDFYLLID